MAEVLEINPDFRKEKQPGKADVVVGLGFGDEGKGKIVQYLAKFRRTIMRVNGGSNAGHTLFFRKGDNIDGLDIENPEAFWEHSLDESGKDKGGVEVNVHQIPTGIVNKGTRNILGPGLLLDGERLHDEIEDLRAMSFVVNEEKLAISGLATLVLPHHKQQDALKERGKKALGSTKAGIAPTASSLVKHEDVRAEKIKEGNREFLFKVAYEGLRKNKVRRNMFGHGWATTMGRSKARKIANEYANKTITLAPYLISSIEEAHNTLERGENIVIEGAQGAGLDVLLTPKRPHSTSTGTTAPALTWEAGLNHENVGNVIGVIKMFPTKVGGGVFPERITNENILRVLRGKEGDPDLEAGKTTGRQREIGLLSIPSLKYFNKINGTNHMVLTKLDKIAELSKVVDEYGNKVPTKFQIVTSYYKKEDDGTVTETYEMPESPDELAKCEVGEVREFDIWNGDLSHIRNYDDLPKEAKAIIEFIEKSLGVSVSMLGVGPGEKELIVREDRLALTAY
jgi:adenylosuccinate synthase